MDIQSIQEYQSDLSSDFCPFDRVNSQEDVIKCKGVNFVVSNALPKDREVFISMLNVDTFRLSTIHPGFASQYRHDEYARLMIPNKSETEAKCFFCFQWHACF